MTDSGRGGRREGVEDHGLGRRRSCDEGVAIDLEMGEPRLGGTGYKFTQEGQGDNCLLEDDRTAHETLAEEGHRCTMQKTKGIGSYGS